MCVRPVIGSTLPPHNPTTPRHSQAMLVTKYLYEEFKQYHYFSLAPAPPIALPEDLQSTDILQLQQALEVSYQKEIEAQQDHSLAWIYIEVNATAEPRTLASMRNGSASVVLPIPLKNVTDPATNASRMVADTLYYQMRLHDVGVYLLDASGAPLGNGPVQVALNKSGLSSFFDSSMVHGDVAPYFAAAAPSLLAPLARPAPPPPLALAAPLVQHLTRRLLATRPTPRSRRLIPGDARRTYCWC